VNASTSDIKGPPPPLKRFFANNAPWLISAVVCLLFVLIIASIFWGAPRDWDKTLLHQLSDTTVARGLITFLIAVATVGIAITLTIYVVATDDANAKDKFSLGKDVLTGFIGILGTIVGFYFGASPTTGHDTGAAGPPSITDVRITPSQPKKGTVITVNATVTGGAPPYHYLISFSQDAMNPIQDDSSDGIIHKDVSLPTGVDSAKPLDMVVEATDKKFKTASTKAEPVHINVAP
jgi:hypothetical protein